MKKFTFSPRTTIKPDSSFARVLADFNINLSDDASLALVGDVFFSPNVYIRGICSIGNNTKVDTGSILDNCKICDNCHIRPYSLIYNSTIGRSNLVGPFAFIRDESKSLESCILGAHVEIARSIIGSDVKISHQSYVGDVTIGHHTIIGSGTVFCNFDGSNRQSSLIGSRVMIGSGSMIISPVEIGDNAIIAAGSIVTKNINPDTLFLEKFSPRA